MKMCASGQWKIKFDPKPRKGMFTKLDGSMVNVPVIFHSGYMVAETLVPQLKAQVRPNTETTINDSSKTKPKNAKQTRFPNERQIFTHAG